MGTAEQTDIVRRLFHRHQNTRSYLALGLKATKYLLILSVLSAAILLAADRWITHQAKDQLFTDYQTLPHFDVAVVLGTSKYLGKVLNEYYSHRIDAAITLFQQEKVDYFLLSGDNAHRSYNEPWTMKRDLLKAEVPEEKIFLDYAGFRTLDSVVRAKEIFDTDDFLIISQKFHCERALFIANSHNINAHCFAVPGPSRHSGLKVRIREVFARAKAFLDVYVTNTQPKFLGPKEPIHQAENPQAELSPLAASAALPTH